MILAFGAVWQPAPTWATMPNRRFVLGGGFPLIRGSMRRKSFERLVMPEFEFDQGELKIADSGIEIRIRGWPQPEARISRRGGDWEGFRPDFRLLKPDTPPEPDGAGLRAGGPGSDQSRTLAFESFRGTLPGEVVRAVERFQSHQWNLIDLVSLEWRALDLVASNPVLAYLCANNDQFRRLVAPRPALQAAAVLARRQREIAAWLGFPGSEAVVRLLRKIVPEAINPHDARLLRLALGAEPAAGRLLSHQAVITAGVLGLVSNLRLLPFVARSLVDEVAAREDERYNAHTADLLVDALYLHLMVRRRTDFPRFSSIAMVQEFHDTVAAESERLQRDRDARRRRPVEEPGRKPRRPARDSSLPAPPLPATPSIVPLTTRAELKAEGEAQQNCVASYWRRVRTGEIAIYRVLSPERATLSIVRGPDGFWRRSELKAARNREVSALTRAVVDDWLKQYSYSV